MTYRFLLPALWELFDATDWYEDHRLDSAMILRRVCKTRFTRSSRIRGSAGECNRPFVAEKSGKR